MAHAGKNTGGSQFFIVPLLVSIVANFVIVV
jgi:cyclophilin family peptidyl-prolyl cis-trans isomerase